MDTEQERKWAVVEPRKWENKGDRGGIRGRMTSNVSNVRYRPPKNRLWNHFSGRALMNSTQIIFHVLQVEAMLIDGNEGSPHLMMWILRRIKNSSSGRTYWNRCDRHLCRAGLALNWNSARLFLLQGILQTPPPALPAQWCKSKQNVFYSKHQKLDHSIKFSPSLNIYYLLGNEFQLTSLAIWMKADLKWPNQ